MQLQSTSLLPDLTVWEQMRLFAGLYGRRLTHANAMRLLQRVGLTEQTAVFPDNLSGGQQQRLALALLPEWAGYRLSTINQKIKRLLLIVLFFS